MQIGQQILHVLLAEFLTEAWHLVSAKANDVADPLIVRGKAAQREEFMLEHALESRALFAARRIRLVAAIAIVIIDTAARRLLRVEPKFGIRFAALDIACQQKDTHQQYS